MTIEPDYFKLTEEEHQNIKSLSEYVYHLTNTTLLETIQKENREKDEEWIESRYHPVKQLWSNHPSSTNKNKKIGLMRIDYAWDQEGNLKVLELNTAAQGGWIDQSTKPQLSYLRTIGKPLPPPTDFLVNYLMKKLGKRILLLVYDKTYNKEIHLVEKQLNELGVDTLLKILVPEEYDNKDKDKKDEYAKHLIQEILQFNPTGIYWKLPPRSVDHAELAIQVANLKNISHSLSFESLYISGDKSFLNTIYKKDEKNIIPKTFILDKLDLEKNLQLLKKDQAVLKPGDEERGKKVILGKNCDDATWKQHIQEAMVSNNYWILQELCFLKKKKENGKYEDLVCFIADGEVISIASRFSINEIVNIHNGGGSQPAVVISN